MKKFTALTLAIILLLALTAPPAAALIKWVDFDVPYQALEAAMKLDIESKDKAVHLPWVDLISLLACQYGGNFKRYRQADLNAWADKLTDGRPLAELSKPYKHFSYFQEAYGAVLGGLLGDYRIKDDSGQWQTRYGLRAYSPLAATFPYSHCDDFGAGRSYGFKRKHLGHDMMCATGTPVICVESGRVEVMGWNKYGGWRVGIRSLDGRRYYYYAHLRKDRPFHANLMQDALVYAGDVIGYVGRTGYSDNENVNNIKTSHLHFGLQLVFDESQKECNSEIWVDVYPLVRLLNRHRAHVLRVAENKEFYTQNRIDPVL